MTASPALMLDHPKRWRLGEHEAPSTVKDGLEARVLRVMEVLVDRYRYPLNGTAGLVGLKALRIYRARRSG